MQSWEIHGNQDSPGLGVFRRGSWFALGGRSAVLTIGVLLGAVDQEFLRIVVGVGDDVGHVEWLVWDFEVHEVQTFVPCEMDAVGFLLIFGEE